MLFYQNVAKGFSFLPHFLKVILVHSFIDSRNEQVHYFSILTQPFDFCNSCCNMNSRVPDPMTGRLISYMYW